jgi:hypothetical protein
MVLSSNRPDRETWRVRGTYTASNGNVVAYSAQADTREQALDLAARAVEDRPTLTLHTVERCRLSYGEGLLPHLPTWHIEEAFDVGVR